MSEIEVSKEININERRHQQNELRKMAKQDAKQKYNDDKQKQMSYLDSKITELKSEIEDLQNKKLLAPNNRQHPYNMMLKKVNNSLNLTLAKRLNSDPEFLLRNKIRTEMCPKTEKGKECKYEDCLFAHSKDNLRIKKCIYYLCNCCENELCEYDHSSEPVPEKTRYPPLVLEGEAKKKYLTNNMYKTIHTKYTFLDPSTLGKLVGMAAEQSIEYIETYCTSALTDFLIEACEVLVEHFNNIDFQSDKTELDMFTETLFLHNVLTKTKININYNFKYNISDHNYYIRTSNIQYLSKFQDFIDTFTI
jgi:hypothetical protein